MKNLIFLTVFNSVFVVLNAQSYSINFSASGESTTLDSVFVENITKGVSITLREDFVLTLSKELGVEDYKQHDEIGVSVYPNPLKGSCGIDFNVLKPGNTLIAVYDISGKLVASIDDNLSAGRNYWQISGLNKGMYFLKVGSETFEYSAKLLSLESGSGEISFLSKSPNALNRPINAIGRIKDESVRKSGKTYHWIPYEDEDEVIWIGFSHGHSMHYFGDPRSTSEIIFELYPCVDSDGYKYPLTKIGSQIWMAENLKVTTFRDSTEIPEVKDNAEWMALQKCARCWWQNHIYYAKEYGSLYNMYCVNLNICPIGYRVPSNADWNKLIHYLGGPYLAGSLLKSRGTNYWLAPNTGATNRVGFNARGGSARSVLGGGFPGFNEFGFWWTYEEYEFRQMTYDSESFGDGGFSPPENGMSIRCIKN